MIAINDYRAMIAQLRNLATAELRRKYPDEFKVEQAIDHVVLAIDDAHLVNLLKDKKGIILCGNIPGFELQRYGGMLSTSNCVLFLVEKMSKDHQGSDNEFRRYQHLQLIMTELIRQIDGDYLQQTMCDLGLQRLADLNIEWEYNIFGGFNGISLGFRLRDDHGTEI